MSGYTQNALRMVATTYGLSRDEAHRALTWAKIAKSAAQGRTEEAPKREARPAKFDETALIGHAKPKRAAWDFARFPDPNDGKSFCTQCDRRVSPGEAAACSSQFCKAMAA